MIKVRELIELLKKQNPELPVMIQGPDGFSNECAGLYFGYFRPNEPVVMGAEEFGCAWSDNMIDGNKYLPTVIVRAKFSVEK